MDTIWSRCPDLNRRPTLYESAALPAELQRHLVEQDYYITKDSQNKRPLAVALRDKNCYHT